MAINFCFSLHSTSTSTYTHNITKICWLGSIKAVEKELIILIKSIFNMETKRRSSSSLFFSRLKNKKNRHTEEEEENFILVLLSRYVVFVVPFCFKILSISRMLCFIPISPHSSASNVLVDALGLSYIYLFIFVLLKIIFFALEIPFHHTKCVVRELLNANF